jgi:hypothetical protein
LPGTAMVNAKKGRPPSDNPMVHTAVMLPLDLSRRLKEDGEASGRGQSGEIRQRLEESYDPERSPDANTSILLNCIGRLADEIAKDDHVGRQRQWYEDPHALSAFKAGVEALISGYRAKERPTPPKTKSAKPSEPLKSEEPSDPPDAIGRTYARMILSEAMLRRDHGHGS